MRLRFGWLVRWVYSFWRGWRPVTVPPPPPPGTTESRQIVAPTRHRALVSVPSEARRGKGPSSTQRRATKRRAHVQALRQ